VRTYICRQYPRKISICGWFPPLRTGRGTMHHFAGMVHRGQPARRRGKDDGYGKSFAGHAERQWGCGGRTQKREHLFKVCPEWKDEQKIL